MSVIGELDLDANAVGTVMQSFGRIIVDRGDMTEEQVIDYLTSSDFIESDWWDKLGRIVDHLEIEIQDWLERQRVTVLFTDAELGSMRKVMTAWIQSLTPTDPEAAELKSALEKLTK